MTIPETHHVLVDGTHHEPELPTVSGIVRLMGMALHELTETETVEAVISSAETGSGAFVVTANLDHLRRYQNDSAYREAVDGATIVVADGMPLVWAARLAGTPLPERVAGSAITKPVCEAAAARGLGVFLCGGNPGVADTAVSRLADEYPGFRCVGTSCPPFGFERDPEALDALASTLRRSCADVVIVALGSPKQELLIHRFRSEGVLPRASWLGVGISLSFVTGEVVRAPRWVQRMGCEWLHRLAQEPRRLAQRYLVDGLPFAARLLCHAARRRLRPRVGDADE